MRFNSSGYMRPVILKHHYESWIGEGFEQIVLANFSGQIVANNDKIIIYVDRAIVLLHLTASWLTYCIFNIYPFKRSVLIMCAICFKN
jgi:hypothetical protein